MNTCVVKKREESGIFGFIKVGEIYNYIFSNKMVEISGGEMCGNIWTLDISDFDKYFVDKVELRMKKLEILGI